MRAGTIIADMASNLPRGWQNDGKSWQMGPAVDDEVTILALKQPSGRIEIEVVGLFHTPFTITLNSVDDLGHLTLGFVKTDVGANFSVNGEFHSHLTAIPPV